MCFVSLRNLHKKLMSGEIIEKKANDIGQVSKRRFWDNDPDVISAVWMLIDSCSSNEENVMSGMLADFISRVSGELFFPNGLQDVLASNI